jgi:predicted Zn-dependent peptidase
MPEYYCDTLENGLRVVSVPLPHHHGAEVLLYVGVGSRHEPPRQAGISHFLEHMLFKGTLDYPNGLALERAFEAVGGSANAATDTETTCFHSRIHPEHLEDGLRLFASMLRRPLFKDLEIERRVILEEALSDFSETGRQINPDNLIAGLLFPNHPLGRPTVGSRACVARLSLAQLQRHHATFYTPANAVLAVAGPIDHDRALAAARVCFEDWHGAPAPKPQPWTAAAGSGPRCCWVRDNGSQVSLQLAFLLPGRASQHAVNLRVIRRLLGWGGMSRLMVKLREELALTYAVEAALALYADAGVLAVDLAVSPDNLVPAAGAILEIFSDLVGTMVTQEELAHVLATYRYDLDYSRDHLEELALRYAWGELTGCRRTIAGDLAELAKVTPGGLQQTAREFFTPARLYGAVVGPWPRGSRKRIELLLAEWRPLS